MESERGSTYLQKFRENRRGSEKEDEKEEVKTTLRCVLPFGKVEREGEAHNSVPSS